VDDWTCSPSTDIAPLTDEFFANAIRNPYYRPLKQSTTVRIDADVLAWLRRQGAGYQTRINAILRRAMLKDGKSAWTELTALPMNPADRPSIERFVRATLGCKCPDEVFQSINVERAPTSRNALPHTRLVIGDRLLIHVFEAPSVKATAAAVSILATQGCAERDAKHYNRYRLVIASDYPTELLSAAKTSFASVAGDDNHAHLHILATDQLPDALRLDMTPETGAA
jgi:hypothetical protein